MEANKTYDIIELSKLEVPELVALAKTFGLIAHLWGKQKIIYSILNEQEKQRIKQQSQNFNIGLHDYSNRF